MSPITMSWYDTPMRIIAAHCSAIYTGRGDTTLGKALRVILIKDDGSVSIHNEVGNKPLNYMKCAVLTETIEQDVLRWTFDCRKESLRIDLHEIVSDITVEATLDDEGLVRDGTEDQLQAWLAENTDVLGEGWTLVRREFPTEHGPVDLLVQDGQGHYIAVEVKRVAMLGAVDQVRRYVDAIKSVDGYEEVRGLIAALDIRPKTVALAEKRGIAMVTIPSTWR